jgi:GMP synthase (glutamine-hydrolysing)
VKPLTFLTVEHEDECPPAWLGQWWEERGVRLRRVQAHAHTPRVAGDHADVAIPATIGDADALVVFGGEAGANDDAEYPWLPATRRLIARTVADGRPFLGVCLGHQLAAVALGGAVGRNPEGMTTGLIPVTVTEAGRTDPLLAECANSVAVQWNSDVITRLPDRVTVLATAPDGTPQAVRFAPWAYGVQFHPEVTPEQFDSWWVDKPSAADPALRLTAEAASAAIHAAREELRHTWRPFAARFVDLVRDFVRD